jgi:outer membrane protein assembly factor BamB
VPLTKAWSYDTGGRVQYALVFGGQVFVASVGTVTALDTKSGVVVWGPKSIGDLLWHAYDAGRIYVLTHGGILTALDVVTGASQWTVKLAGDFFDAPPIAADGLVYVNTDYTLFAVAGATGAMAWKAGTGSGNDGAPAYANGVVYLANSCAHTIAWNAQTGQQIWNYVPTCAGGGGTAPTVFAADVYVRDPIGNLVFDASTGRVVGTFGAAVPPAFVDGTGYFVDRRVLSAVSLDSRTVRWTFSGDGYLSSAPVAAGGYVFIGSSSGNLYGLDGNGKVVWSTNFGLTAAVNADAETSSMTVAEGTLLVPVGKILYAFR